MLQVRIEQAEDQKELSIFHLEEYLFFFSVNSTQLVRTIHNICKVRGLNPEHHQKRVFFFLLREVLEELILA